MKRSQQLSFLGVIPARYGSSRLPGKPLKMIAGKPMIRRVYEGAKPAFEHLVVATDDERIARAVSDFGGEYVMTSPHHRSGTDRCLEALNIVSKSRNRSFDAVVNIQGDEPLIKPAPLELLKSCFDDPRCEMATAAKKIRAPGNRTKPGSDVYVVMDDRQNALYFSRAVIPFLRDGELKNTPPYYKHIGLYAYTADTLKNFAGMPPSPLEKAEQLEQNRQLEAGRKICVALTDHESLSVDTQEDLERVIAIVKSEG